MATVPLTLFGLAGSRDLAELVAGRLEIAFAPHEERSFEDGNHKTRSLQEVRGHNVSFCTACTATISEPAMTSSAACCSSTAR